MRRRDLLVWFSAATAGLALAALLACTPLGGLLGACPLRAMTGIPCPTCGGVHAVGALAQGRIGAAFLANPLVAASSILLAASALAALLLLPLAPRLGRPKAIPLRAIVTIGLLLLAANWAFLLFR
jgi:hypothetical protein